MRTGRPSRTAHLVTLARAAAHQGLSRATRFSDPTAKVFLNERGRRTLLRLEAAAAKRTTNLGAQVSYVFADLMALRTLAIDEAVRDAITSGASQVIILGAGYDGRAWRIPELAQVHVYEMDYPSTQRHKRDRALSLPPSLGHVHFIPIDLELQSIDEALSDAGHDPALPTCWIWEGVVMYLTKAAMRATLAGIAHRSAAGSTLIVNYHTKHQRWFIRLIFRWIGEPQISAWTPGDMAHDLAEVGFAVREDSGMADWNQRYAQGNARVERAPYMRVVVARKK